MSISGPISFLLPEAAAQQLGDRMRQRRLADNVSRKTLASQSGVPAPTIRRFEETGKISLLGLLQLADALGCLADFSDAFPEKQVTTIEEFTAPQRKRGTK